MKKLLITTIVASLTLLTSININNNTYAQDTKEDTNIKEEITSISQEDAMELLKNINPEVEFLYQGDENTFTVLKDKGYSGYVFLPNVDGDIGYFVDKDTSDIYYFHPSGYMELIK